MNTQVSDFQPAIPTTAKVMVIDDDEIVRMILDQRLRAAGYRVVSHSSAVEAISEMAAEHPDLILLDVTMPQMSGTEACRLISAEHPSIPVLFLTSHNDTQERLAGFEAGGRDFIAKTFDPAELMARIKAALHEKSRAESFEILSITDPLTGVSNRRYFDKVFPEELARARRDRFEVSCLMIDIDDFKSINDTFGHAAGDAVIARIAHVLRSSMRTIDLVARYGGEEFIVVLHNTGEAAARATAERTRIAVEELETGGEIPHATVSIGGATGSTVDLLRQSDRALYEAKRHGKNRVEWGEHPIPHPPPKHIEFSR